MIEVIREFVGGPWHGQERVVDEKMDKLYICDNHAAALYIRYGELFRCIASGTVEEVRSIIILSNEGAD